MDAIEVVSYSALLLAAAAVAGLRNTLDNELAFEDAAEKRLWWEIGCEGPLTALDDWLCSSLVRWLLDDGDKLAAPFWVFNSRFG